MPFMSSENLDLLEKQSLHVFAVLAIRDMIACLYNESGSLWAIQEQLIEIVRSTPVESVNSLIDQ